MFYSHSYDDGTSVEFGLANSLNIASNIIRFVVRILYLYLLSGYVTDNSINSMRTWRSRATPHDHPLSSACKWLELGIFERSTVCLLHLC